MIAMALRALEIEKLSSINFNRYIGIAICNC
jgi:hypothetical protein